MVLILTQWERLIGFMSSPSVRAWSRCRDSGRGSGCDGGGSRHAPHILSDRHRPHRRHLFPVGEAIAGLISHPPGVNRCDAAGVCGPAGLIVSARTTDGAVDNLLAVNEGSAESGLAQSDVVAAAVKGDGPFKSKGKQSHVRVIASLFSEDVHLVAADKANIKSVSDLRGKRVSLGLAGSGVSFTARDDSHRLSHPGMRG